jgi:surfeit locus 1 family protein
MKNRPLNKAMMAAMNNVMIRILNIQVPDRMDKVSKGHSGHRFKSWLLFCAALVLPLFIALGIWQLDRAEQKRVLLERWQQNTAAVPRALDDTGLRPFDLVHHSGYFDPNRWYLLDNRTRQGRAGYEVIALFYPERMTQGVLVNLGWVAGGPDRSQLPMLMMPSDRVTLQGRLSLPASAFVLGAEPSVERWPRRIQYLEQDRAERELDVPLMPWLVRPEQSVLPGADLNWSPVNMPPVKHTAYALQWFAMALMLGLMTLWSWWQSGKEGEA